MDICPEGSRAPVGGAKQGRGWWGRRGGCPPRVGVRAARAVRLEDARTPGRGLLSHKGRFYPQSLKVTADSPSAPCVLLGHGLGSGSTLGGRHGAPISHLNLGRPGRLGVEDEVGPEAELRAGPSREGSWDRVRICKLYSPAPPGDSAGSRPEMRPWALAPFPVVGSVAALRSVLCIGPLSKASSEHWVVLSLARPHPGSLSAPLSFPRVCPPNGFTG